MSDRLAVNDKGEAMYFDGSAWKPAQIAANDRGERVAFDGSTWVPIGPQASLGRRALDMAGDVASDVGDFAKRAGEYRDTQLGKAAAGIVGLPRAAADAITWTAGKVGVSPNNPVLGPVLRLAAAGHMAPSSDDVYQAIRMPNVQGTGPQTERGKIGRAHV